jgi:Fe-S cluster biogenesis protein NfuA
MYRPIDIEDRIRECLHSIEPYLIQDGGGVEFVRYEKDTGVAEVRLIGNCTTCPLSLMTLRAGIERYLINAIPEIKRVERVL